MRDQPHGADDLDRLGQRVAAIDQHVTPGLHAVIVVGPADLPAALAGDERHRPVRVVHPGVSASRPPSGGAADNRPSPYKLLAARSLARYRLVSAT